MCALAIDSVKSGTAGTASEASATGQVPDRARAVVVGGGVIGCSIAYHLTRKGCRDVLLLERKAIGCGTTWHSHGVVGLTRASPTLLRMAMETARLLPELERETGKSTGYSVRGSVNVTADPSRMLQFRRFADIARIQGLPIDIIDAAEAGRLWPHLNTDGLLGAMHLPTEGQCNPLDLTQALAAGARLGGAHVMENVTVTGAASENGRIVSVDTTAGPVECDILINSTGLWARDFLRAETGGLALQAIEHNYLVTEFSEDVGKGLPLLRDPDLVMTLREDAGQISVGFNEHEGKVYARDSVPDAFAFDELPPDWDAIAPYWEGAASRVPILNDLGIRLFLCGPEAATPDTRYMMGPVPPFSNYFVAAGFSGIGVGSAGGAGAAIAHWALEGRPPEDLWDVDVRRMMPYQANRNYILTRTPESNGKLFAMNWPHRQNRAARGVRRSPLHAAMAAARACFIEVGGWEVPEWFAPDGIDPVPGYSFERPDWFAHARSEAQAALTGVALHDRSMAGKFLVIGRNARQALAGFGANTPPDAGRPQVEIPMLNATGGVEAMFTSVREAEDRFLLIGETATQRRDRDILERYLASHSDVGLVDMTASYCVLDIVGPQALRVLQDAGWRGASCSETGNVDPAAEIGFATALLMPNHRYGVPAWTIMASSEFGATLYEALTEAGAPFQARPIGRHARHALQTLAGSPVWAQGLTPDHSPIEAGLETCVDLTVGRAFSGRDVCVRHMREGVNHRLCRVIPDDADAVLLGHEPVRIDGVIAGAIDQAAYALASSHAVGLAYLSNGLLLDRGADFSGPCEVCIAGRWFGADFEALGRSKDPMRQRACI